MSSNTPLPSSFDGNSEFYEESRSQKLLRRLKEEPLLPLGCALTCAALLGATRSMRAGDHHRTQRMFRARIAAQAFTLVAMVAGSMYWDKDRKRRKEFEDALQERKDREKREAWLRELEVRDEEEKEMRAQRERRRARREEREAKLLSEKTAEVIEEGEEKGKGIMDSVYGLVGLKSAPKEERAGKAEAGSEPKFPKEGASSMIDPSEQRRIGVLEMVRELVSSNRN